MRITRMVIPHDLSTYVSRHCIGDLDFLPSS
jgi:hypothetical protein